MADGQQRRDIVIPGLLISLSVALSLPALVMVILFHSYPSPQSELRMALCGTAAATPVVTALLVK